jgi:arsenite-transporting ATPase
MTFVLTFIGKGGSGRTTMAIASAQALAQQGQRVLLLAPEPDPSLSIYLGTPITPGQPQTIANNLQVLQLLATQQLTHGWEQVKQLEKQYLRTPFFKDLFGQEFPVLPGMDGALALNTLRELESNGQYDAIVLDGSGDLTFLRLLGMPTTFNWYARKGKQVLVESDLGKTLAPFLAPIGAAVLNNVNFSFDQLPAPLQQAESMLTQGENALKDPSRIAAYLVTTPDPAALATAKYLWGSAQQMGIHVAGVLLNQATSPLEGDTFAPLPVTPLPTVTPGDWSTLSGALPNLQQTATAPSPLSIDIAAGKISLFLPGFDKTQVKLSQYGPEVTVEAGDQRRNVMLPPELQGRSITGAKFLDGYLIISF